MAFIDKDETGDRFINLTNRVSDYGMWDDVMVVQALLDLAYAYNRTLKSANLYKRVTVDGSASLETKILIAHFQKTIVKQIPPKGYVNKAAGPAKRRFTIWILNSMAESIIVGIGQFPSVRHYLRAAYPRLAPVLSEPSSVRDEPRPQRDYIRRW